LYQSADPKARKFATDLFKYSTLFGGTAFNSKSICHLVPSMVLTDPTFAAYLQRARNTNQSINQSEFISQYKQNNLAF